MRIFASVLALFFYATTAFADNVPPAIIKSVKPYQIADTSLVDGVLRHRTNQSVLRNEIFKNIVLATCLPLSMSVSGDKSGWGKARIERIEIVNQIGAQGFAYVGGRKSCEELQQFAGSDVNAKAFSKNTWVCVAGNPCRQRRDGEVTSGD